MRMSRASHRLACLLCFVATAAVPAAVAQSLTLGQALDRAAAANPALAAMAADSESIVARAELATLPPQLTLGSELENFAGSGALSGVESAEATLQVTRVLELGGKRAGRRSLGDAEIAQAGHSTASARLDLEQLTTRRFVEVVADQQRLALARERVTQAEDTRQEVARVVGNARNPETDLRAAEIVLADAGLDLEHAQHELSSARVTLAASWGATRPDFDTALPPVETLADAESFESLAKKLAASAMLRALDLESATAQAREQLARRGARPDVTLSLGVRRLEVLGDQALVMSASLPLGAPARSRLAAADSRAQLTAIDRRREAVAVELHQQLFELCQELGHARTEFTTLGESMIPKAEHALALASRGFDAGRFPFNVLSQAQVSLFELRRRRIDAAARHQIFQADIQRLVAAAKETP